MPSLETQVVDIADEIAYDNHDIDDGLTSGLIGEDDLKKLGIWENINRQIDKKYDKIKLELRKYQIIRLLIDIQVTDLITQTENNIKRVKLKSSSEAKKCPSRVVSFSKNMLDSRRPLREFLMNNLYHHYRVVRMSNKAKRFIMELFEDYLEKPEQLPAQIQKKIPKDGVRRVVCDYIAGMTDRYALDEYKKLFYPYEKV